MDEENKTCSYIEVPDEIYEKEHKLVYIPQQPIAQIKEFENNLKDKARTLEINSKVILKSGCKKLIIKDLQL